MTAISLRPTPFKNYLFIREKSKTGKSFLPLVYLRSLNCPLKSLTPASLSLSLLLTQSGGNIRILFVIIKFKMRYLSHTNQMNDSCVLESPHSTLNSFSFSCKISSFDSVLGHNAILESSSHKICLNVKHFIPGRKK